MQRSQSGRVGVVLAAAVAATAAAGGPAYHVAPISDVIAPNEVAPPAAVNEDGDAVGEIWFAGHRQAWAYSYEAGPILLPLVPGYTSARAFDVSDRDAAGDVIIVGSAAGGSFSEIGSAAYWRFSTLTGAVTAIVDVGGLAGYGVSAFTAVNNAGHAVGYSQATPDVGPFAAMWYDFKVGELAPLDFPARPVDLNDAGQLVGGAWIGGLDGDLTPVTTPPGTTGVSLQAINEDGDVVGTVGMPYTDGAGHFVKGAARRVNGVWELLWANSWLDAAYDINDRGDVVGALGAGGQINPVVFIDAANAIYFVADQIDDAFPYVPSIAGGINGGGQIAAGYLAALLTPLGEMIIPGDVNGDAEVTPIDLCAWIATPVDLDGDGVVAPGDEQWLIDRLASLGYDVVDCNANGAWDVCDIADGVSTDCNENGIADECEADCDGDGVPDDCETDCNANGLPDDCDISEGRSEDCNGNGVPDECDEAATVPYLLEYDVPVYLPPNSEFEDDFLVTGAGVISDVDFTLDIDYRIGNLRVELIHDGVTITLLDQPGVPETPLGNGQLGYRAVLDDEGTGGPIEDQGNFGSPFEPIVSPPAYTPDDPLATFDGLTVGGVWTVRITTIGFSPVSALYNWGLVITNETAEGCTLGDLDGDGAVNAPDLAMLLAVWGPCDGCDADLNGDGVVDAGDLAALLAAWTG